MVKQTNKQKKKNLSTRLVPRLKPDGFPVAFMVAPGRLCTAHTQLPTPVPGHMVTFRKSQEALFQTQWEIRAAGSSPNGISQQGRAHSGYQPQLRKED